MYRQMFGLTDRAIHQSKLSKLLFDLYQEGLTPPQVNHVQSWVRPAKYVSACSI